MCDFFYVPIKVLTKINPLKVFIAYAVDKIAYLFLINKLQSTFQYGLLVKYYLMILHRVCFVFPGIKMFSILRVFTI